MISDEMLAVRCLEGDTKAFEELVNRYKNQVFAIVYRMIGQYQEAEDITQEVFVTVYEKLYQFDTSKKFGPWIYRIATNTTISAIRKKKKILTLDFDEMYSNVYEQYTQIKFIDPLTNYENQELKAEINQAILELPESYKIVILLRYQLELDNQEIADILSIKKENVEVKIHRARKALRKILLKKWEERGINNELPASR